MNDPAIKAAIKQLDLKPGKNGDKAVKVGSRQKTPKVNEPLAPASKKEVRKRFTIQLTSAQEARLIRESAANGSEAITYLQGLVEKQLDGEVGKPIISSPSWAAKKITGPTRSFE